MRYTCYIIYVLIYIFETYKTVSGSKIARQNEGISDSEEIGANYKLKNSLNSDKLSKESTNSKCWITLNAKQHFQIMDRLDDNYAQVRNDYQKAIGIDNFDKEMLNVMLDMKGKAFRAIHNAGGNLNLIPAGLNLGGYGMLRLDKSVLFFHRLKLRNDTRFRVNYLSNDFVNMTLTARLDLNDLHLKGSYERALTSNDLSRFVYTPTFGQVEFLLKDVQYKMEGRYRLLKDRLTIEHVISEIKTKDTIMNYVNKGASNEPIQLRAGSLDEFMERLKTDLDDWLKDYFNDYLMYFGVAESEANAEYEQYDKKKTTALNDYVDDVIKTLRKRILKINADNLRVPNFEFHGDNEIEIVLSRGQIRGLDTMHRRSVATGRRYDGYRKVDVIIGFSKLKVDYKYDALLSATQPALSGNVILSADEMTAHMSLTLIETPESVDISFDALQQMKPESLTLDGPANRVISNFKHLLEHHILAVMTNAVVYSVKQLSTLAKCEPFLPGQTDPVKDEDIDESDEHQEMEPPIDIQPPNNPHDTVEYAPISDKDKRFDDGTQLSNEDTKLTDKSNEHNDGIEEEKLKGASNYKQNEGSRYGSNKGSQYGSNKESKYGSNKGGQYESNKRSGDVFFSRKDSAELIVPQNNNKKPRKMHLSYNENLELARITK